MSGVPSFFVGAAVTAVPVTGLATEVLSGFAATAVVAGFLALTGVVCAGLACALEKILKLQRNKETRNSFFINKAIFYEANIKNSRGNPKINVPKMGFLLEIQPFNCSLTNFVIL
jgi:hypothetical protein